MQYLFYLQIPCLSVNIKYDARSSILQTLRNVKQGARRQISRKRKRNIQRKEKIIAYKRCRHLFKSQAETSSKRKKGKLDMLDIFNLNIKQGPFYFL